MNATLLRDRDSRHVDLTLGTLTVEETDLAVLEHPWIPVDNSKGGMKSKSCVPDGEYRLIPHNSPAHPNSYALINHDLDVYHYLEDVPDEKKGKARTVCLIHIGNFLSDTEGCILPGMRHTTMPDTRKPVESRPEEDAVASSGDAMKIIRKAFGQDEHTLTITRRPSILQRNSDLTDADELASENIEKVFT